MSVAGDGLTAAALAELAGRTGACPAAQRQALAGRGAELVGADHEHGVRALALHGGELDDELAVERMVDHGGPAVRVTYGHGWGRAYVERLDPLSPSP